VTRLVDVDDSVLVVVDTQPGFLKEIDDGWAADLVQRIRWLVRLARALDVPIVVTEEEAARNGETASPILEALDDAQARYDKEAFGLAACPPILADLERHGRRTAVLCGLETDVCVSQSALGLLDAGWRVVVVEDGVASPMPGHEQGIRRIRDAGAELIGLKTLTYEWVRRVDRLGLLATVGPAPPGVTL
jgi:nicotinamidase-related amidase